VPNLTFFEDWLIQKVGHGWEIHLSENGEQFLIRREDRNPNLLKRIQKALVEFADGVTLISDKKEGRLVVQGTKEEINQFLYRLEEDYNTSCLASSVF
jgi:hypothetical protein